MRLASFIAALVAVSACATGSDWPRWRGPDGTARIPAGEVIPRTLPSEPRVLWHVPIGPGHGSPVVSRGRVFYLDNQQGKEVAHAADAVTGQTIWSVTLDDVWGDSGSEPGPRGTPTVDEDRVYVQSCRGEFRCLRVADGSEVWRVSFVKDFGAEVLQESGEIPGSNRHGNTATPLVDGNRLYVVVGGHPDTCLVCFDKRTGRVLWKSQDDVPGHAGPVWATIVGVRQLVLFTASAVIGIEPGEGRLLWRVPIKTLLGRNVTTPVVVGDMVVVGSYTAGLIGVRVARTASGWTAEVAWKDARLGVNFASPVAVGGYVYCIGPGKRLFCVDARTGSGGWVNDDFFSGMIDAGFASFLVAGSNLLILAERGQLLLVPASPRECRVLARAIVCGKNWCTPAYVGGRLYLRDAKELRCVQIAP